MLYALLVYRWAAKTVISARLLDRQQREFQLRLVDIGSEPLLSLTQVCGRFDYKTRILDTRTVNVTELSFSAYLHYSAGGIEVFILRFSSSMK